MLLSAVSVLVVAQSSSEIPEGLMNNPVYLNNSVLTHILTISSLFNGEKYPSLATLGRLIFTELKTQTN